MQMLRAGGFITNFRLNASPFQAIHYPPSPHPATQYTGGPYSLMQTYLVPPGIVTQPLEPPTSSGLITAPGPVVSTIPCSHGGDTAYPCTVIRTGFPFTTGTVFAQQSTGIAGDDFFTAMGSDLRTALGAGNIALIAGGLSRRVSPYGRFPNGWASFGRVQITLAPPTPSLSPAGLATAALLLLLAAGYAARRRHR